MPARLVVMRTNGARVPLLLCLLIGAAACRSDSSGLADVDGGDATTLVDAAQGQAGGGAGGAPDGAGGAPGLDASAGDTGPAVCPITGCDPFTSSGCAAGQLCQLSEAAGVGSCVPATTPPKQDGEVCRYGNDCAPGFTCVSDKGATVCRRLCITGSVGSCGPGQLCTARLQGQTCVSLCLARGVACDIYAQDCSNPAEVCTLLPDTELGGVYVGCGVPGPAAEGTSCETRNCAKGTICVRTESTGAAVCRKVCRPGGTGCTAPQTCSGTASKVGVTFCK